MIEAAHPGAPPHASQGPPRWLIVSTVLVALLSLVMSVAETTLWIHFVVDRGESISLVGLGFIFFAGLFLHRQRRLARSLPLVLPWVLYPVVTQGDQLIDNLNINQMRAIVHAILALLFGGAVAVLVVAAVQWLSPRPERPHTRRWTVLVPGLRSIEAGRTREGGALLAATLLVLEMWVAQAFLGALMVLTLIAMTLGVLAYLGSVVSAADRPAPGMSEDRANRLALYVLVGSCVLSLGLYVGYKNRPGAYQGSPHYYHDPSQRDAAYAMSAIALPAGPGFALDRTLLTDAGDVLRGYADVLGELLAAYYVLDRNYNYWFHNELFLRNTPVLAGFRETSLSRIASAREQAARLDGRADALVAGLPNGHPLEAFVREVRAYVQFNLRRAGILEGMTASFQQTKAGLQHATHLYEGEGKAIGAVLSELLAKHQRTIDDAALAPATEAFVQASRRIHDAYANRIVGF